MANGQTDFGRLSALHKTAYSAKVLQAGRDDSFFMGTTGFMGKGLADSTKPIHYVNELTSTERGDKCIMPLVQDLTGDGVIDDNDMEGNEELLEADYVEINISQLRNAVKKKGRMSEQRTVVRFRAQAKDKLAYWLASKTDELFFLVASGVAFTSKLDGSTRTGSQLPSLAFAADVTAPSTNRKVYSGTATSTATLTASDKMSWNLLVKARALAERRRLKPIRIKGANHFVVVMSTEAARDLKLDPDYRAIAASAEKRGKDNPLFNGAFLMVDSLILYSHPKVYTTYGLTSTNKWGASGTVDGSQALLMGAQALGYAKIGNASWEESDNTDYKNKEGVAYGIMMGLLKPVFESIYDGGANEDFSIISIYVASSQT